MPDAVRSCEMKTTSSNDEFEVAKRTDVVYPMWLKLCVRQALPAEVDIGHVEVLGQKVEGFRNQWRFMAH